jgi:hypothetical protein
VVSIRQVSPPTPIWSSSFSQTRHMSSPSHYSGCDHANNIWRGETTAFSILHDIFPRQVVRSKFCVYNQFCLISSHAALFMQLSLLRNWGLLMRCCWQLKVFRDVTLRCWASRSGRFEGSHFLHVQRSCSPRRTAKAPTNERTNPVQQKSLFVQDAV